MRSVASWWVGYFALLALVLLSGVTSADALSKLVGDYPTRPVNQRQNFDPASEVLPMNLVDARLAGATRSPGDFMFRMPGDVRILDVNDLARYDPSWVPSREDLERRETYQSQFGLQARVYAAAAGALGLGRDTTFLVLKAITAALLAAMLATMILLIHRSWGRDPALAALSFSALATGFNLFAPSLYWVTFLHVAPAAVTSALLMRTRLGPAWWAIAYLLVLVLFIAKFLSGFELMSITVAAAAVPFFLAFSAERVTARQLAFQTATIFGLGLLAFAIAMAIYEQHHQQTFGSSGFDHLTNRTADWAAQATKGLVDHARDFAKVLLVNFVDVGGFGIPNLVPLILGMFFVLKSSRALVARGIATERARVELVVSAAFAASVSWLILQEQHVVWHPRYSAILMAYPFGLFLAAGAMRLLQLRKAQNRLSMQPRAA